MNHNSSDEILFQKKILRKKIRSKQNNLNQKLIPKVFLEQIKKINLNKYKFFASYYPMSYEVDVSAINEYILSQKKILGLPQVVDKNMPLVFRKYLPNEPLSKDILNIPVPLGEIINPQVILIPLLAFDRNGNRLGKGGGFYDRTLKIFPNALKIGIAFSYQELLQVPVLQNDEKLNLVITEKEIIFI